MKYILSILLLIAFSSFSVCGQNKTKQPVKKKYVDKGIGLELSYPDSVTPVILKNNEDIKAEMEPFVIEIYKEKAVPFRLDTVPDACYKFSKVYKNKYKAELKEYTCTDGAAGSMYYTFLYIIERKGYDAILLKFLHKHCNVCIDEKGNSIPFNEKKDIRWINDIVESVQIKK